MNWFVLAACLIVYPLFGITIYLIRNRLAKTQNFSIATLAPVGVSFILGIAALFYAIVSM